MLDMLLIALEWIDALRGRLAASRDLVCHFPAIA
jgi:hypothetical protein